MLPARWSQLKQWMRTISNESACAIAFRHGARWRKISWSQRRPDTVIRGSQTMLSRILPLTILLLLVTSLYAQAESHRVLVYEDRNGNGHREGGKPGLAGVRLIINGGDVVYIGAADHTRLPIRVTD